MMIKKQNFRFDSVGLLIATLVILQVVSIVFISNWVISYNIVPGILITVIVISCFWRGQLQFNASHDGYWLLGFFVWLFTVGFWTVMSQTHYYFWSYLLVWPLVYWLYLLKPAINQRWTLLFTAMVIVVLTFGLIACYQYLVLHQIPLATFNNKNNQSALANLVVFPCLSYLFIRLKQPQANRFFSYLLAFVIFLLFVSVTISGSRAATLASIFGLLFFVVMVRKQLNKKYFLGLMIIIILPILYGIFFGIYGGTKHSFFTLFYNPLLQGANRFVTWNASLQLIKQHYLFGIGLGNFYWYLPAIKSALDKSAGLYVHNDYLQILLESGVIGMLLFLAVIIVLGKNIYCFFNKHVQLDAKKIEVLGLSVGLATVFFHSIFSFNLYLFPILMIVALLSGRIHYLIQDDLQLKKININFLGYCKTSFYQSFVIFISTIIFIYYITTAVVLYLDIIGDHYLQQNNLKQAKHYYDIAAIMHPNQMELLISEMNLYNQLDKSTHNPLTKLVLLQQINYRFNKLATIFPKYAGNYFIQAQYYQRNQKYAGNDGYCKVKLLYEKTLALWPLSPIAQQAYAQFISKKGNKSC